MLLPCPWTTRWGRTENSLQMTQKLSQNFSCILSQLGTITCHNRVHIIGVMYVTIQSAVHVIVIVIVMMTMITDEPRVSATDS